MMNRKAVSAVVATVLIILITVAAITIIWTAVIPMIKTSIEGSSVCLEAQSEVSLIQSQGYTCWEEVGGCSVSTCGATNNQPCTTQTTCEAGGTCDVATCGATNNQPCTTQTTCEAETDGDWEAGVWSTGGNFNLQLHIEHGAKDFKLGDIQVQVYNQGNSETKSILTDGKDKDGEDLDSGKEFPGQNEAKRYLLTDFDYQPDKVEIAPVVKTGATTKTCQISSTVSSLSECA